MHMNVFVSPPIFTPERLYSLNVVKRTDAQMVEIGTHPDHCCVTVECRTEAQARALENAFRIAAVRLGASARAAALVEGGKS